MTNGRHLHSFGSRQMNNGGYYYHHVRPTATDSQLNGTESYEVLHQPTDSNFGRKATGATVGAVIGGVVGGPVGVVLGAMVGGFFSE